MRRLGPLGNPMMTAAVLAAFLVAHVVLGRAPTETTQQLIASVLGLAIIFWMMLDARMRRRTPCHDFGFLAAVYFPVSLIWYVFWSRGRRGWLTLGALVGLWVIPWISAMTAWMLWYGRP